MPFGIHGLVGRTLLGPLQAQAEREARRRLRAEDPELVDRLEAYRRATTSIGCSYADYWALYREVRARQPREVLECGTGVSTLVLAWALRRNHLGGGPRGRVTSMEELPEYHALSARLLPEPIREYADICLSPTVEDAYCIFRGVRYRDVPRAPYDFVFVDGPDPRAPSDGTEAFDFDLLRVILQSEAPVAAMIDRRLATCYVMQKVLGAELVRYDAIREHAFVGPCSKRDVRWLSAQSSPALTGSLRVLGRTVFHLTMESRERPPGG